MHGKSVLEGSVCEAELSPEAIDLVNEVECDPELQGLRSMSVPVICNEV